MAGRGGYQAPAKPAAVSGPGALSQRTDGGPADKQAARRLPDAKYGENKNFQSIESGAPMGVAPTPEAPHMDASQLIPFTADSARPNEPVTAGADAGAGPDSSALGIPNEDQADLQSIIQHLPMLEWYANQPGASPSFKAYVRRIKAAI